MNDMTNVNETHATLSHGKRYVIVDRKELQSCEALLVREDMKDESALAFAEWGIIGAFADKVKLQQFADEAKAREAFAAAK